MFPGKEEERKKKKENIWREEMFCYCNYKIFYFPYPYMKNGEFYLGSEEFQGLFLLWDATAQSCG